MYQRVGQPRASRHRYTVESIGPISRAFGFYWPTGQLGTKQGRSPGNFGMPWLLLQVITVALEGGLVFCLEASSGLSRWRALSFPLPHGEDTWAVLKAIDPVVAQEEPLQPWESI